MYKLKIFISSDVDKDGINLFSKMRKRIKSELENLRLFNVYIYEEGYGTSKNVVDDYLDEIDDSHICLFLINSADGVPDGVQKEINIARKLNKPQIYIFNHARTKVETALEKELKNPQGSRIKIVDTFNDFYNESIESIKSEVVKIYKDYSSGRLVKAELDEEQSSIDLKLSLAETHLKKSYITGFSETRKLICSFLDTEDRSFEESSSNDLDGHTKSFFDVLIGKKNIIDFNTTFYLDKLKEWHPKEIYEVVKFRWKAIEYYFAGDLENCIENLDEAYKTAEDYKLSSWLIQDILIDLRNKMAMKHLNQNGIERDPTYQKLLTNAKEVLSYPVIDRLDKQLLSRIEKKRKDELFKKAHSTTYDNVLSEYAGMLNSIYVVAAHYGSLTHLELLLNRIQEVYLHLVEIYSDWEFKLNLLKVTIYLTKKKDLERILRKYNEIYANIASKDVERILEFVKKHPNEITQKQNELLTLTYLGYYLDDDVYAKKKKEIDSEFNHWLDDPAGNVFLGDYYFKCFKENTERLEQDKIVNYANKVLSSPMARFYDGVLEVLKEVNYKEVNEEESVKLLGNIIKQVEAKKLDRFQYLRIVLVKMYKNSNLTVEIDKLAKSYFPNLEKKLFISEVKEEEENPYKMFRDSIQLLQKSNNKSKVSFAYGYNYFSIIKSTLNLIKILPTEDIDELLDLLVNIVINDNQDSDAKVEAFQLMIYLKNNDLRFSNMDPYYREVIKYDRNILQAQESFMFNHSSLVISFNYFLYKSLFSKDYEQLQYQFISDLVNADLTEKLSISKAIRNYLFGNESDLNSIVIQMLFILKSDLDEQVRANIAFSLIYLVQNQENESLLIELSKMMDTETTLIKNIILRHIDKINHINPEIVQYIVQKGRVDNHYMIRHQAKIEHGN